MNVFLCVRGLSRLVFVSTRENAESLVGSGCGPLGASPAKGYYLQVEGSRS